MNYYCCTENRRNIIKVHPYLNGIDFLEVDDDANDPDDVRQKTLYMHFLKPLSPGEVVQKNILIKGGETVTGISAVADPVIYDPLPGGDAKILEIKVDQAGDYSTYTLCLVENNDGIGGEVVLEGFDTLLSKVDFSFKVLCESEADCQTEVACAEEDTTPTPDINYLAKDYASFRQLMLDRMSLLVPDWQESSPADLGITLVELLAYAADYLSYRQDAITSEAYLHTSRKRKSAARHAKMVDYEVDNGCNARTWVQIHVGKGLNGELITKGEGSDKTKFFTKMIGLPTIFRLDSSEFDGALNQTAEVFEMMHDLEVYHEHNEMHFYTYGEDSCCLPKGATEATLRGDFSNLKAGDFLVLAEVLGTNTGEPEDADPAHRQVVRLVEVSVDEDIDVDYYKANAGLGAPLSPPDSPPSSPPWSPPLSPPLSPPISPSEEGRMIAITKIKWHQEDALRFPLCISHEGERIIDNVSVAYGNIVLTDHGRTVVNQGESSLVPATVPAIRQYYVTANNTSGQCATAPRTAVPPRFSPVLNDMPLTFVAPADLVRGSARALMQWSSRTAMPSIRLKEVQISNLDWVPKRNLITDSAANDRHFVVEMESDGVAHIRFGNDENGSRPNEEMSFMAEYRLGNGRAGNIGAKAIYHIAATNNIVSVLKSGALGGGAVRVWNPLPAQGGKAAETLEEIKQYAPQAFRTQERAVTAEDYNRFAQLCHPEVQSATTFLRWTGSWKTVTITVDRLGGKKVDDAFKKELSACLEKYRLAGFDLKIESPIFVSLDIEMEVCVKPGFFRGTIRNLLLDAFSNRVLSNGKLGFFHSNNFSFGQPVYLSDLYVAAQSIEGVASVKITKFEQQGNSASSGLEMGRIAFGQREIARLDNNSNAIDQGVIRFTMKGGQ